MRFSPRTWSLLSLMLFVAAAFFWLKGNEYQARKKKAQPAAVATNTATSRLDLYSTRFSGVPLAQLNTAPAITPAVLTPSSLKNGRPDQEQIDKLYPHRLRNTSRPLDELMRQDHAILLANALIDTDSGEPIEIPEHLRSKQDPGSYIVQWHGPADNRFRQLLADADAQIVSYVPNNAYYVRVAKSGAEKLQNSPGVQSVIAFEPYFKLDQSLLSFAIDQSALPENSLLRLTLLPGARDSALQEVAALGAELLAEEPSPFGPQLVIRPEPGSLVALAGLNSVQGIEPQTARKAASDLSRLVLGIAPTSTNSNYFNLNGANILVNINDTGIDTNHPSLKPVSIIVPPPPVPMAGADPDGHGTFVASLIAGSGDQSPSGTNAPSGSLTNASFRGIAPAAKLLALPLNTGGGSNNYAAVTESVSDSWLIESAARTNYLALKRTNSLISNNSWTYERAGYDSAAARYDAAVRDAIPGAPNAQPMLFVFAAGNSGFGDDDGTGGQLGRVETPGTAKNVITVGALEQLRLVTNFYTITNIETDPDSGLSLTNVSTNFPFIGFTDSDSQVASFSSRGNVGIGIEGTFGRFKPDVVAPGAMLVGARSSGWQFNGFDTNEPFGKIFAELQSHLQPYRYDNGTTFAAANVSGMLALLQQYFESQSPTPTRGIISPALAKALLINGSRSLTELYDIAVQSAANFQGWGLPNLLNSLSSYDTNSHSGIDSKKLHLRFVEQSATNALATGESRTWKVTLTTNASTFPLRVTLVWTDPPGNPAVGVKLVNDLDLVVTNTETGAVFYGNNIPVGADFSVPILPVRGQVLPTDTVNNVENIFIGDPSQLGRQFTITVRAHRVNVNAVNDYLLRSRNTNDVVQDFALVVSSDMGADPRFNDPEDPAGYLPAQDIYERFDEPTTFDTEPRVASGVITNGLPLFAQRVGANATLVGTNGVTNQWNFYVFTNVYISNSLVNITNGSNVAFVTFDPPNLARPRASEADIDLYVSKDSRLTNLHPAAVAAAVKSVERSGTETVIFTNALVGPGEIYYVAVKSEDQQAAEFSLIGISTDQPFQRERNGRIDLFGLPYDAFLPDGSARRPTAGTMLAIGLDDRRAARVVVTNRVTHENFGDLVGLLSHKGTRSILNNHLVLPVTAALSNTFVFDDNNAFPQPASLPGLIYKRSDGPGTLLDFAGEKISGAWFLQQIDNAPSHTGRVESLTITIDPLQKPLIPATIISATVSNTPIWFPVDVPPGVTNITFRFTKVTGGPLEASFRQFELPQTNLFDIRTNITTVAGTLNYPGGDPSLYLAPGTHFLMVRSPTGVPVSFDVEVIFGIDSSQSPATFARANQAVVDDTTTNSIVDIAADKLVANVKVSVNMPHPRSSDMRLALVSPQGSRVLLAENRGGSSTFGFGSTSLSTNAVTNIVTNVFYTVFTDDTNLARLPVKQVDFSNPVGLTGLGVQLQNGFEGATDGNYAAGQTVAGWNVIVRSNKPAASVAPDQVSIITGTSYSHSGTNLMALGTAGIRRQINTTAGRPYKLRFAVRAPRPLDLFSTGVDDNKRIATPTSIDQHYQMVYSDLPTFPGPDAFVLATNSKAFGPPYNWTRNNSTSQWVAPYPNAPANSNPNGTLFIFRTYVDLYDLNPVTTPLPTLKWAADDLASDVLVNGKSQKFPGALASAFGAAPFKALGGLTNGLNVVEFQVDDNIDIEGLRIETAGIQNYYLSKFGQAPTNIVQEIRTLNVNINGRDYGAFGGTVGVDWSVYAVDFIGTGGTTTLEFHPGTKEVWLDTVSVEATADFFVQPEEPLEVLNGERAIGEWRLELQDSRTGVALPATGLSWKLDISYADPFIRAEHLGNGSTFGTQTKGSLNAATRFTPGIIKTNQTHYFVVEACPAATSATITLTGIGNIGGLQLLADRSGIPTGNPDTDDYEILSNTQAVGANGVATFKIDTARPAGAPLNGKRFFLAVRNVFLDATNTYSLTVAFTGGNCPVLVATSLSNGQSVSKSLAAQSANSSSEEDGDIYAYNVEPGTTSLVLDVQGDGDVSIVGQKDLPPTRDLFSHFQNTPGSGSERLVINSGSGIPLTAGLWYFRVLNNTEASVTYSITATDDRNPPSTGPSLTATASGGQIRLLWSSIPGAIYDVQGSTDLLTWSAAGTVTASGNITTYTPPATGARYRFYRLIQR